ncbi:MAG TPA: CRISPR-associated protein Csx19 [Ktedonobacteraceae bacterium]|nr:CRISPR-associated protein Csx19 [Ktedonobacteraceae bacterium]
MAEILYTGLVAAEKVQKIVAYCNFTLDALFLAEQIPTHFITNPQERLDLLRFTYFKSSPSCIEYTSGRIFQEDRELRWEKQEDKWRVVYLGEAENGTELQEYKLKENQKFASLTKGTEPKYYYLFGERLRPDDLKKLGKVAQPGDFAVVRIPRILRYPVCQDNHRYVRLAVCEYLEAVTGRVALFRFQRLETVE